MQAISYLEHPVRGVGCKETAIIHLVDHACILRNNRVTMETFHMCKQWLLEHFGPGQCGHEANEICTDCVFVFFFAYRQTVLLKLRTVPM